MIGGVVERGFLWSWIWNIIINTIWREYGYCKHFPTLSRISFNNGQGLYYRRGELLSSLLGWFLHFRLRPTVGSHSGDAVGGIGKGDCLLEIWGYWVDFKLWIGWIFNIFIKMVAIGADAFPTWKWIYWTFLSFSLIMLSFSLSKLLLGLGFVYLEGMSGCGGW